MMRHAGLVVELGQGRAVVLTPDGQFKRVRAKAGWQLGEEVRLENVVALPQRRPATLTWVAAAAIILAMLLPGALSVRAIFGQTALAAYVAVDINPSLELQVSGAGKVLAANAVNDDAAQLLQSMNLQGLPLDQAVRQITEKAIAAGYLTQTGDNMVLITVTPSKADGTVNASLSQRVEASQQVVKAVLKEHQLPNAVETLSAPAQVRDTARSQGLSTGKLLVASEAAEDGVKITSDELKNQPLGKILSQELKGASGSDKRAVVNDFLTKVKSKDHGDQKDKVKAVDDLVKTWHEKQDGNSDKSDDKDSAKPDGKVDGNTDGQSGTKAPDNKDKSPRGEDGKKSDAGQPAEKSVGAPVTPLAQVVAPVAPAVTASAANGDRGNPHGKGRKGYDVEGSGWQTQFRDFFARIFGRVADDMDSNRD